MRPRVERFEPEGPSIKDLVSHLVADLGRLLDAKVTLLKLELRSELSSAARGAGLLGTAAVTGILAITLLMIALAVWIGELVGSIPGGFAILGGVLGLVAGVLAAVGLRTLRRQKLVPEETIQELRRDVEWVKRET
jgi:hypothetical protein